MRGFVPGGRDVGKFGDGSTDMIMVATTPPRAVADHLRGVEFVLF